MTNSALIPAISVLGVIERDIDLLLLEEAFSNPAVSERFVDAVLPTASPGSRLTQASKSVSSSLGESDLEFWFQLADGRRLVALVENKIAAFFQKDQASRYRQRAEEYLLRGEADLCRTVLFAPRVFLASYEGSKGFDVMMSYEEVADWIKAGSNFGARGRYKVYLLESACEKASFGYLAIEDQRVSAFWMSYWHLAIEHAPELEMKQPSPKPARSGFVYFHPPELPKGVDIVHKLPHGNLDLQFRGMGNRLSKIRRAFSAKLERDMQIAGAAKSGVVRIAVHKVNPGRAFEPQQNSALEGLLAASRLLEWHVRFGHLLESQ